MDGLYTMNTGGSGKRMNKAIGIDPDSQGYVCCLVEGGAERVIHKAYTTTNRDLESMMRWVRREGEVLVVIEGSNGLSRPLETALRKQRVVFYALRPSDVCKFRKAVLGRNKNNEKDAESVARFALALQGQGMLGDSCDRGSEPM